MFNFMYRYMYIDNVLSINNTEFEKNLSQMYPVELEIKDIIESNISGCTEIKSYRSRGMVNFILPFLTTGRIQFSI